VNDVTPGRFRRQIEGALRAGYQFVPASRIAAGEGQPHELAITFDDGLATVATNAAPILAEYGIPWTRFVVSGWADGRGPMPELLMRWPDIERLIAGGAEIGSHSATHSDFSRLRECELERELVSSRDVVAARLGVSPASFAIPNGRPRDWSERAAAIAREAGYEHVFSACEDRRAPGTVGRTMITSWDGARFFRSALRGAFDGWEEWIP
jgi:peptidoglycan/xylan/chitin deacetylase (PgdA/CDA1 family)